MENSLNSGNSSRSRLPEPGSPLVLADGTRIDPTNGRVIRDRFVEIPTHTEAQREITAVRRRIADLPDVPQKMNTVSVVLSYVLFGLSNREIGLATGLTEEQVGVIRTLDAYNQMYDAVVKSIVEQDADDVRAIFTRKAKSAAKTIADMVEDPDEDAAIRLTAAKDLLDRAGHRPADVIEHRHKLEGGLTIEVVKTDRTKEIPVLELNVDEGE